MADYRYTQSYLAIDAVDEVFLIDITRGGPSEASRQAMWAYGEKCFAPVTMGGWVRSVEDVKYFMGLGADKVVISAGIMENPGLITEISEKFGSQAVVAGLDLRQDVVEVGSRGELTRFKALEWAKKVESLGAGEIFLQSIEKDGSLLGYDLPNLSLVAKNVSVPVVIGGGCGGWRHMKEGFEAGADGCVTSVIHHFTEASLKGFKSELSKAGLPVRVN